MDGQMIDWGLGFVLGIIAGLLFKAAMRARSIDRWRSVIANAGVEMEDVRMGYVTIQIDREDWLEAKKAEKKIDNANQ